MSRPRAKGPRSLIRTVTHPSWQTLTSVPKGSAPLSEPNDAKAVLGVLVGDPLDQPRQQLSIGWTGLRLH